jgi:hypothetical protein
MYGNCLAAEPPKPIKFLLDDDAAFLTREAFSIASKAVLQKGSKGLAAKFDALSAHLLECARKARPPAKGSVAR